MTIINNMLTYHPEAADFLVEGQHIDMPGDHEADEKILGARVEPKVKTLVSVEQAGAVAVEGDCDDDGSARAAGGHTAHDEGSVLKRHLRRDRHRGPQGVRHHLLHVPGRAAVAQHDRARAERAHLLPLPARGGERRELLSSERRRRARRTSPRRVRRRVWIERVDGTHERQYRDERSFDVSFVRRLTGERSRAGQERAKAERCVLRRVVSLFSLFFREASPHRSRPTNQPYLSCLRFRASFSSSGTRPCLPDHAASSSRTAHRESARRTRRRVIDPGGVCLSEITGARFGGRREGAEGAMFLLSSASGIARSFATLTLGGRDGGETRGPAGQAGLRHASAPASPGVFTSLMRRAPRAAAPRWVAARASPGGSGGGGGSSYGGDLSMDSSRDDSGARNDYWRGGAGGSEGRRGRGGGGRGSYARAEGDRGASPSRGARGRGRGDGKRATATHAVVSNRPAEAGTASSHASADRRHGGRGGRGGGGGGRGRNVEPCSALAAERKNKMRQHTGALSSWRELRRGFGYASEHARTFTAVNFSTAIHKLGKLNRSARGRRTKHAARLIDDPRFADLETAPRRPWRCSRPPRVTHPASPSSTASGARARCPARCGASPTAAGPREMWIYRCRVEHLQRRGRAHCPELFADLLRKVAAFDGDAFSSQNLSNGRGRWRRCTAARESESRRGFFRCRTRSAFGRTSANGLSGRARGSRHGRWRARSATWWRAAERRRVHPEGVSTEDVGTRRFEKHEHQRRYGGDANVADLSHANASRRDERRIARRESDFRRPYRPPPRATSEAHIAAPGRRLDPRAWSAASSAISTAQSRGVGPSARRSNEFSVVRACFDAPHVFSTQSVANILWAAGNTPELVPLSVLALDRFGEHARTRFSSPSSPRRV